VVDQVVRLADWPKIIPAQTVVQSERRCDLPLILCEQRAAVLDRVLILIAVSVSVGIDVAKQEVGKLILQISLSARVLTIEREAAAAVDTKKECLKKSSASNPTLAVWLP